MVNISLHNPCEGEGGYTPLGILSANYNLILLKEINKHTKNKPPCFQFNKKKKVGWRLSIFMKTSEE